MTESTATLDGATALRLLRETVAEHPDHVYRRPDDTSGCVYVYGGHPSCLVGHVLVRFGIPVAAVATLDGKVDSTAEHLPEYFPAVTREAADILDAAQIVQDSRRPWRDALTAAEKAAQTLGVSA